MSPIGLNLEANLASAATYTTSVTSTTGIGPLLLKDNLYFTITNNSNDSVQFYIATASGKVLGKPIIQPGQSRTYNSSEAVRFSVLERSRTASGTYSVKY